MAKILPNEPCPCGSGFKYKKCCTLFHKGQPIDNAERLLRTRYTACINVDAKFLWETLHPQSPRKLNDSWAKFERETQLLRHLRYKGLRVLDADVSRRDEARIVFWVEVFDADKDVSFLEEATFKIFETRWHYFDGLRRSSQRLGCLPESIRLGDLETLFLHDSKHH